MAKGPVLFPRIDLKTLEEGSAGEQNSQIAEEKQVKEDELITIEDFARLDIRVAQVIDCQNGES